MAGAQQGGSSPDPGNIKKVNLHVMVVSASELYPESEIGSCNPYIEILITEAERLKSGRIGLKTETQKNTSNPKWNAKFYFNEVYIDNSSTLLFEVFNSKSEGEDEFLGQLLVNIHESSIDTKMVDIRKYDKSRTYDLKPRSREPSRVRRGSLVIKLLYCDDPSTGQEKNTDSEANITPNFSSAAVKTPMKSASNLNVYNELLPVGWECRILNNGLKYYVNHESKHTQWSPPPLLPKGWKDSVDVFGRISYEDQSHRKQRHQPKGSLLPVGWEKRLNEYGQAYYVDHINCRTQWQSPKLSPLPEGWEEVVHTDGRVFYKDYINHRTQWQYPRKYVYSLPMNGNDLLPEGWDKVLNDNKLVAYVNHRSNKCQREHPARLIKQGTNQWKAAIEKEIKEAMAQILLDPKPGKLKEKCTLLHPLTKLDWKCCHTWKEAIEPTHCVVLHDIVVVQEAKTLHISSVSLDSWVTISSPSHYAALTTYKSKFVLAGGREALNNQVTNKVLTSLDGLDWEISLPPMPTSRYESSSVSGGSPEILIVAGGRCLDYFLDVVEVLIDHNWYTADPLPATCTNLQSILHNSNFYFTGALGEYTAHDLLYTCTFDSLLKSTSSERSNRSPIWRQILTLGTLNAIVSYSSHLIGINSKCITDVYSNITQSWLEISSTEHVPQKGNKVSASLLPSDGHLVIANGYGVFSISLSVSDFNLDKNFFYNDVTKLEAVMGLQIMSVLAALREKLTNMSKVTLKARQDKRTGLKAFIPGLEIDSVEYVEELIHQWSLGHSTRHSTWRELLQVIQDIGQLELRQQIETFLKGESSYLQAYYHFIGTKESLDMLFLKFLFLGPPRNGKTTVRRRLLKEIVDLISAGEADKSQPSTGTVESSDVVVTSVSGTTAVITESEWSALKGLVDEARMLLHSLLNTMQNTPAPTGPLQPDDSITLHLNKEVLSSTPIQPSPPSSPVPLETRNDIPVPTPLPEISSTDHKPSLPQEIPGASKIFKEAMESEHWKDVKHIFKAYMKMEDTGGQPELMDMLPALTLGPDLYLLFINLQYGLDHHYKLTYCNASGESTPPIESVYSVQEMLLSSLSSISCSNAASLNRLITSDPYMKNSLDSSKSVAFIVGTHKDKASTEEVKKLNEDLKKVIIPTQYYKQDIVQFASEDDLIIALDNMAGGAEEVNKVREILEDCMTRHFKKLKIPAVWLFFSIFLRHHEKRITTLEHCMELSSTLGMSAHETEVALWFLHHHAGVLMYFPNVPELKDLVIIDVKVVYDSVTILILEAMNYYKVGHSSAKTFKKTGKFTLSRIIAATRGVSGDHIPVEKLVVLLEFLHIITPVPSDQSSSLSLSSIKEVTYVMPCILKNATTQELDIICQKPKEVPRIMFPFKCGAVPIGVFPALLACLTSNPHFTLIQDEMYKNIIQFHFGDFYTLLTLVCRQTYYECFISEFSTAQAVAHKECVLIRNEIESTLTTVSSRMNYGSFMDYELAFDCPLQHADSREHFCIVDRSKISSGIMLCQYNLNRPKPIEIPTEVKVWFGEPLPNRQSSEPILESLPEQCGITDTNDLSVTLKTLRLLERRNDDGSIEKLCILKEVCSAWKDMGMLVGLSPNRLKAIEMDRQRNPYECCADVLSDWLIKKGTEKYAGSWQGLCVLLKDLEYNQLVSSLEQFIPLELLH